MILLVGVVPLAIFGQLIALHLGEKPGMTKTTRISGNQKLYLNACYILTQDENNHYSDKGNLDVMRRK